MLQREPSTILLTFIKLPFVIKIHVLYIFEWPLKTGLTVPSPIKFVLMINEGDGHFNYPIKKNEHKKLIHEPFSMMIHNPYPVKHGLNEYLQTLLTAFNLIFEPWHEISNNLTF